MNHILDGMHQNALPLYLSEELQLLVSLLLGQHTLEGFTLQVLVPYILLCMNSILIDSVAGKQRNLKLSKTSLK